MSLNVAAFPFPLFSFLAPVTPGITSTFYLFVYRASFWVLSYFPSSSLILFSSYIKSVTATNELVSVMVIFSSGLSISFFFIVFISPPTFPFCLFNIKRGSPKGLFILFIVSARFCSCCRIS